MSAMHNAGLLKRRIPAAVALLLAATPLVWLGAHTAHSQTATDPGLPGPCAVISQTITAGQVVTLYYPSANQCGAGITAPFPGIAFAHGFSMFGLSNGAVENAGNGEHLASWGYVVAIPNLDDDAELRVTETITVLNYLETATQTPGSFLYQKIDRNRLATAGHSLGGATALAVAARDARVKAVVALDPVYHEGSFGQEGDPIWHPEIEGPTIAVPTGILGAPPSDCNAQSDYQDIYPLVGATHKASFRISDASHCDFADPGNSFCSLTCGEVDAQRTQLSQKYMTAWFNYYLHVSTGYYAYLYGSNADSDVASGVITHQIDTAPHGLTATGLTGTVTLEWQLYPSPVIAGYNIYRRLPGASYSPTPLAHIGQRDAYLDIAIVGGQVYSYTLRSYDAAGNLHQLSGEVSAIPRPGDPPRVYLPAIAKCAGGLCQSSIVLRR